MQPVLFKEHNVVFGEGQPEYLPLPAYVSEDPTVPVITCWEFTDEEIEELVRTKRLYLRQLTFGENLQPLAPQVHSPFVETVQLHKRPFVEVACLSFLTADLITKQSTEAMQLACLKLREMIADLSGKGEPIPSFVSFNLGTLNEFIEHRIAADNAHLN